MIDVYNLLMVNDSMLLYKVVNLLQIFQGITVLLTKF